VAKRRKLEAKSFVENDLRRLSVYLEDHISPEDRVLRVLLDTGLRIGDVLRLTQKTLADGLQSGIITVQVKGGHMIYKPIAGAELAWNKLYAGLVASKYRSVAKFVCPTGNGSARAGDAAYQVVNRHLKEIGQLSGRLHLHRLRRTFAVDALRYTQDITAVQQALGHRNISTTQQYTDELRIDDVAELQKNMRRK